MKGELIVKMIALLSYFSIILMGEMIGIPFVLWLIVSITEFGDVSQLFAFLSIVGILILFSNWYSHGIIKVVSFILMLSPIAFRLSEVPLEKFDYLSFQIPLFVFIIMSVLLMLRSLLVKK